ncbi:MAG: substrate-binding domain-containing protein [Fimbriimonadales bacterium]
MTRRNLKLGVVIAAMFVAAVGCEKRESAATGDSETGSGGKVKVVYIPKNSGNPYFSDVITGFEEASSQLGCEFTTVAPATADATSQIPMIKEQIQRKVNVIAISPNSPDALNSVLDDARKAGIIVITVDADLTGNESHRDACVLPTDFTKVGSSQIELMGSQMKYEGEFAILSATRDAPNQNAWIEGMKAALKEAKYAKMKLVDIVYGDDEPQKSSTEAEALFAKHPNLKGILSPTSVGLAAAAQSLQIAGLFPGGPSSKGGGIWLTGLSTPNQMKRFVENGVVQSFQLWSPKAMGMLACDLGVKLLQKKLKTDIGEEFDSLDHSTHTFGDNAVVFTGPLVTFDKANISEFDF